MRSVRRPVAAWSGVLILLCMPIPASVPVAGATFVSGTLAADTTWNASGSPYIVIDDVIVPAGVTLTVDPGVQVRFSTAPAAPLSIRVFGRLLSVGRPDLHTLFTSDALLPDRGDWMSVVLDGSVGSVIEYTDFLWGSITLDIERCGPRIANNTILESGDRAVQVIGPGADPVIERNLLATQLFNQRIGIVVQNADPVIRDNSLQDNYFGIFVDGGSPRVENNTVRGGWIGFVAISATPVLVGNVIERNGLANYGGFGVLLSFSTATLLGNTIRDNAIGIDLPYDSRQTLARSSGNVVNGIPLGTLYHLRARDLVLAGLDLDSGRSGGFTGNATQQGLLTFYDSTNVTVAGARLTGNGALVFSENSSLLVANSTLDAPRNAFRLARLSAVESLNTTFPFSAADITDDRSTLTVRNFLHVRAVSDASAPLAGVRVQVTQDGLEVGNGTTGGDGWSRWQTAAYGVFARPDGSPAPVLYPAAVRVAVSSPGTSFDDNPRGVDMSASRAEVFRQTDRTPPTVLRTIPTNDSIGVALGGRVTIVFSEPMNRTATEAAIEILGYVATDFTWTDGGRAVSFSIRGAGYGAAVFVRVDESARDAAGNRLPDAYLFTFDVERAPRRVDLTPVWIASVVVLALGLSVVAWRRSRARTQPGGEEEGGGEEEREP